MYNLKDDKEKYFCLGKVLKTHSYKGELVFLLDSDEPEYYKDLKMIFINMDQSLVPWFIEEIEIKDDLAIVKLEDVEEQDHAREFVNRELYLPVNKLKPLKEKMFYFHEVIGFKVVDKNHGEIGFVEEILQRPEQELIRIMKGKKEILVPLSDSMIDDVDRGNKILYLDTPSGLIELYLG